MDEEVVAAIIVDTGSRAADVLPACLERKLGFDMYNRQVSLPQEKLNMDAVQERKFQDTDKLKRDRAKAAKGMNLKAAIAKLQASLFPDQI